MEDAIQKAIKEHNQTQKQGGNRKVMPASFVENRPFCVTCRHCGQTLTLRFNGGELDQAECCGFKHQLKHVFIEYVVTKTGAVQ